MTDTRPRIWIGPGGPVWAMQWTGSNTDALADWTDDEFIEICRSVPGGGACWSPVRTGEHEEVRVGDWITRDRDGEGTLVREGDFREVYHRVGVFSAGFASTGEWAWHADGVPVGGRDAALAAAHGFIREGRFR